MATEAFAVSGRRSSAAEVVDRLNAGGVSAVIVLTTKDLLRAPRFIHSGRIVFDSGEAHVMPLVGRLAEFSGGQMGEMLRPAGIGEHSAAVLREGGLSDDEIEQHLASGCIRKGQPMPRRFGLTYR